MGTDIEGKGGMVRESLKWLLGILVVVPALINSAGDIYRAIQNSPIGPMAQRSAELHREHWDEVPLAKRKFRVEDEAGTRFLKVHVYADSDIWVQYGKYQQWLPAERMDPAQAEGGFFPAAHAGSAVPPGAQLAQAGEQPVIDLRELERRRGTEAAGASETIERTYLFRQENDDHSGFAANSAAFADTFRAVAGYRIVEARVEVLSANRASTPEAVIADDGKSVRVTADIKSGPIYNRWKGWVKAEVLTRQVRAE